MQIINNRLAPLRGSTLIIVVVMTVVVATITGAIMSYSHTEARLNQSDLLMNEARFTAEATLNHGMAQLRSRFNRTSQLSAVELEPQRNSALQLQTNFLTFMGQTRALVPETYTRPENADAFQAAPVSLGARVINNGRPQTLMIDPFTQLPQQGGTGVPTFVSLREVRLYAKSTTSDPRLGTRTAYARQTLQIMDRSLFGNTVYYNGLLEIFPGAGMNLGMGGGPIYAPRIHIGNNPAVHTRMETSGDFIIGRYNNSNDSGSTARLTNINSLGQELARVAAAGATGVLNPSAYLVDLTSINNPTGTAIHTGTAEFRELALQGLAGGLMTAEHGITGQSAVGLEFLQELSIEDAASGAYNTNGVFDQGLFDRTGANHGHLLIEPSRSVQDISVLPEGPARDEREALNTIETRKWSNMSSLAIELLPDTGEIRMFYQPTQDGQPVFDVTGNRVRQEILIDATFPTEDAHFWEVETFEQSGNATSNVTSGLYDFRQGLGQAGAASGRINLLRLDMQRLRNWVEARWTAAELGAGNVPSFDSNWWNGGIYVKLPEQTNPLRSDRVVPAVNNWAVQLHNAAVLPNRRVVDATAPRGLTLATNGAIYVQGDYNAPTATYDSTTYGEVAGAEVPAALVGDAITLLSNNWSNSNSAKTSFSSRRATNTTHSTALVTGNVPSIAGGGYSGGLENYPRFLENWGDRTHTYRGSLVRLFRSESFSAPWRNTGQNNGVYNAPTRNWSFHTGFALYSPPLGDGQRIYRRIDFKELTAAEFNAETRGLFPAAPPSS